MCFQETVKIKCHDRILEHPIDENKLSKTQSHSTVLILEITFDGDVIVKF